MGKKKRLSHDQKRKAKLAKEARRSRGHVSTLAYEGSKYKTEELIPVFHATEVGIYEIFVMTDRKLTDRVVRAALEKLIVRMRQGPLPSLEDTAAITRTEGDEEDFIIWAIRRHWKELEPRPSVDNLIGVLRTTLNSIHVWSSPNPESRGYLHYIEGFLKKTGVSVDVFKDTGDLIPEPEDPELLDIGRAWCIDGHKEAAEDFRQLADEMIQSGAAETVVEVCNRLISEIKPGRQMDEVMAISVMAQRALM